MSHTTNVNQMWNNGPTSIGLQDLGFEFPDVSIGTKVITGGIHHTGGNVSFLQDLGAEFPDIHIGTKVITGGIHHTGGDVKFLQDLDAPGVFFTNDYLQDLGMPRGARCDACSIRI